MIQVQIVEMSRATNNIKYHHRFGPVGNRLTTLLLAPSVSLSPAFEPAADPNAAE